MGTTLPSHHWRRTSRKQWVHATAPREVGSVGIAHQD